jgi:hypothetical protein
MAKGGFYPLRKFVGLSSVLKNHHTNIQSLFRRYLGSSSSSRPAIVLEILLRLQSHLAREEDVLLAVIHNSGPLGIDLIEDAMLEHEEIRTMMRQFQQFEREEDEVWEEMFEDMMQTAGVHFIAEQRHFCRWLTDHGMRRSAACPRIAGKTISD